MIATAHISVDDLAPFERLRRAHFPAGRNFLQPHLTMFYQLSDTQVRAVSTALAALAGGCQQFPVSVIDVRHLGSGVAYSVAGERLTEIRDQLRTHFKPWLSPQDLQGWRPHITVQNGVASAKADLLFAQLQRDFVPSTIGCADLISGGI